MEILSSRVLIRPRDLERTVAFYREVLGLHVYREFGTGRGRGHVFFLGGGFLEVSGRGPGEGATDTTQVWLQVRDVRATCDELRAHGVAIEEPPEEKPWGSSRWGCAIRTGSA